MLMVPACWRETRLPIEERLARCAGSGLGVEQLGGARNHGGHGLRRVLSQHPDSAGGALAPFSHCDPRDFASSAAKLAARFFATARCCQQANPHTDPQAGEKRLHGEFLPVVG